MANSSMDYSSGLLRARPERIAAPSSAAPGRHARGALQALLPPVNGHVLQYAPVDDPALSVYITGDTLNVEELRQVPERHPDLDLGLWSKQSSDNPVYYVQYAHARLSSILRNAVDLGVTLDAASYDPARLATEREGEDEDALQRPEQPAALEPGRRHPAVGQRVQCAGRLEDQPH